MFLLPLTVVTQTAFAVELDLSGSVRLQAESVSPDTATDQDYTGFRDGYSRLQARVTHKFANDVDLEVKTIVPFDVVNGRFQDAWINDVGEIRTSLLAESPKYGTLGLGQNFLPFYMDIASPVDNFTSYYSGFASYTAFRKDNTVMYKTPDIKGLKASVAYAQGNGNQRVDGKHDDLTQATVTYTRGDTKAALGIDNLGGADNRKILGASIGQNIGNVYLAAKYEQHQSDVTDATVYGHDGSKAVNLYASYTQGKHTFKGHVAKVDNYGGDILHLGYDYKPSKKTTLFAEYYSEESGAAISHEKVGISGTYPEGGTAVLAGVRYDFSVTH